MLIATGALPWIAVVIANDSAPRADRHAHLTRKDSEARELDSREHLTINPATDTPVGSADSTHHRYDTRGRRRS